MNNPRQILQLHPGHDNCQPTSVYLSPRAPSNIRLPTANDTRTTEAECDNLHATQQEPLAGSSDNELAAKPTRAGSMVSRAGGDARRGQSTFNHAGENKLRAAPWRQERAKSIAQRKAGRKGSRTRAHGRAERRCTPSRAFCSSSPAIQFASATGRRELPAFSGKYALPRRRTTLTNTASPRRS